MDIFIAPPSSGFRSVPVVLLNKQQGPVAGSLGRVARSLVSDNRWLKAAKYEIQKP